MKKLLIAIAITVMPVAVFGQLDTINVGTTANDGTGESLRSAMLKVNDHIQAYNAAYLYRLTLANYTLTLTTTAATTLTLPTSGKLVSSIDTASMLTPYIARGDTASLLTPYIARGDTAAMLTNYVARGDTASMLTPYVARGDTASMLTPYVARADTAAMLTPYVARADTASMLGNYARNGELNAALLLKVNVSDSASMLTPYIARGDTASFLTPYIARGDTASMLTPYIARGDTSAMLANYLTRLGLIEADLVDTLNIETLLLIDLDTDTIADLSEVRLKANIASPTFTGTVTIPTPFTLGSTSVTANGTELNLLDGVTDVLDYDTENYGATGTGDIVLSAGASLTSPNIVNTPLATGTVAAGTGITASMLSRFMYFNTAAAIDITADPQIANGTSGQIITIVGSSDTNTLTLEDGTGLHLSATFVMGIGDTITLLYEGNIGDWVELGRSNN